MRNQIWLNVSISSILKVGLATICFLLLISVERHEFLLLLNDFTILLEVFVLLFVWALRFCLLPLRRCVVARQVCLASRLCFVQPAWPCAYRKRRWIRRESGTQGSSFWPRLERGLAENPSRRSLLSFVESVRRKPMHRGLRGWDRYRFRAPVAPAASCPAPAAKWLHQGEWQGSETRIITTANRSSRIHLVEVLSLNSLQFSLDLKMLLSQSLVSLHLSSDCCRFLNYFLKIACWQVLAFHILLRNLLIVTSNNILYKR